MAVPADAGKDSPDNGCEIGISHQPACEMGISHQPVPDTPPLFQECIDVFDFDGGLDVDVQDFAGYENVFGR